MSDHEEEEHGKKKKKHGGHGGHGGGGGGHEEGGHHAPGWIVSFADMVILLMSFFVLLLATGKQKSSTDEELLRILASIKVSFGYVARPDSKDPLDMAVMQMMSRSNRQTRASAMNWPAPAIESGQQGKRDFFVKARGGVGRPVFFPEESAELTMESQAVLDEAAEIVRNHYRVIVIQGHCSTEEAKKDSDGGFALSYKRANVLKEGLEKRGIAAARLRLVACGPYVPVSDAVRGGGSTESLGGTAGTGYFERRALVTLGTYFLPEDDLKE